MVTLSTLQAAIEVIKVRGFIDVSNDDIKAIHELLLDELASRYEVETDNIMKGLDHAI